MTNQTNQTNQTELLTQTIPLLESLIREVQDGVNAAGGCDHEVGICMCSTEALLGRAQSFLEKLKRSLPEVPTHGD